VQILDLGCGSGVTSHTILTARKDAVVTSLDNEAKMIEQATANLREFLAQGRCRVVQRDALDGLKGRPAGSFDVVASALTLHNLRQTYRSELHREIYRVLKPGGLFVNADKYAEGDEQRYRALQVALGRFFDAFVPLGKLDLLRDWVLHNVADQGPDRVMREEDAVRELRGIAFRDVAVRDRHNMEAVLTARKPKV
jgi:SAM-dependent methyltransferase